MSAEENSPVNLNDTSLSNRSEYEGEPMDVSVNSDEMETDACAQSEESSKGYPITELRSGYDCWGPPPLPPVQPSSSHTVLYKLPWRPGQSPKPYPTVPVDRWDQEHVRMPNSSESLYPVQETDEEKGLRLRWELVQEALLRSILNSHQLESAILSYNSRYNEKWNFRALHTLFDEVLEKEEADVYFRDVLPGMVSLALQLPELVTGPLPLLRKHKCHTVSLSQLQIGSLLANAFFCTFPRRNSTKRGSEYAAYPDINFNRLFQCGGTSDSNSVLEKLKCILNYFRRICKSCPQGTVTFSRRYMSPGSFPNWGKSTKQLPKLHITSSGFIENEGSGMLQVDFANKFIGGGVLGWGCVQEEIRFVVCPELIVSRLFTECLDNTEALIIAGCERFSAYTGYGHTFEWAGDYRDETPFDPAGRRHCSIVAMDALCFGNPSTQYNMQNLVREVNKAYVGFCEPEGHEGSALPPVATGNWGCGAFRGDAQLKALLQLIAAGEAGRALVYFTFGDQTLCDRIYGMYKYLTDNSVNVGHLWNLLNQYSRKILNTSSGNVPDLYEFLYSSVLESFEKKVPDIKPTVHMKRKEPPPKAEDNSCSHDAAATSRDLAEAGLTAEDIDNLIEEFDSDAEQVEVTQGEEPERNSSCQPASSSCLSMIEESLQKEHGTKKAQHQNASKPKLLLSASKKDFNSADGSADDRVKSNTHVKPSSDASDRKECNAEKEQKCAPTPADQKVPVSDCQLSNSSKSSTKRNIAPKRKISDYFNPA